MLRIVSVVALVFGPFPVWALSCMPWHLEHAFNAAQDSPDLYIVVTGQLEFDPEDYPQVDWDRQQDVPPETEVSAQLRGQMFMSDYGRLQFDEPVTLKVSCAGPWCPSATSGDEVLAFLRVVGGGYELEQGACGGMLFARPDDALLRRVEACLYGDTCRPPAP